MPLNVHERFWQMDNRFWVVDYPTFGDEVGCMVIGFMCREELCCDGAEVQMEYPSREIEHNVLADILDTHGSVLIWDLHTRETVMMTKRGD